MLWVILIALLIAVGLFAYWIYEVKRDHDHAAAEAIHVRAIEDLKQAAQQAFKQDAQQAEEIGKKIDTHTKALNEIYAQTGLTADEIVDRFSRLGLNAPKS